MQMRVPECKRKTPLKRSSYRETAFKVEVILHEPALPTATPIFPALLVLPEMNIPAVLTLGIPEFHASFATANFAHGVKAAIATWEALRTFDTVLLAALVTTLLNASAQANVVLWFFVSSSIIQAVMGLVCSTILIIFFADYHEHERRPVDVAELRFLIWSVYDLFSLPAIWTAWGTMTFIVALIVKVVVQTQHKPPARAQRKMTA